MAYKAPLPMRFFHYVLWAIMLFVVLWFFLIPLFVRVTTPRPPAALTPGPSSFLDRSGATSQDPDRVDLAIRGTAGAMPLSAVRRPPVEIILA